MGKRERLPEKPPTAKQQAGVEGICRQSVAGIGKEVKTPRSTGYLKRRFVVSGSLLTALKTEGLEAAVGWVDKPNISRDVVVSLGLDPTYA